MKLSRRDFLKGGAVFAVGAAAYPYLRHLQVPVNVANPLAVVPQPRLGEGLSGPVPLRRQLHVRVRAERHAQLPAARVHAQRRAHAHRAELRRRRTYKDQNGKAATAAWNPRGCLKGFTFTRRLYGPYRLKFPMVRAGWKEWADDGFPAADAEDRRKKYKFASRGHRHLRARHVGRGDRPTWRRGSSRSRRRTAATRARSVLAAEGYQPEMIEDMGGAGTRTMKLRGGMGLPGVMGKYGMYRMSQHAGAARRARSRRRPHAGEGGPQLVELHVARRPGARPPVRPRPPELRMSTSTICATAKLLIQVGKNLVENKMPESHFLHDAAGTRRQDRDDLPGVQPAGNEVRLLDAGAARSLRHVDLPRHRAHPHGREQVRRRLRQAVHRPAAADPHGHAEAAIGRGRVPRLHARADPRTARATSGRGSPTTSTSSLGDYVDLRRRERSLRAITRDDVGARMKQQGIDPKLEYRASIQLVDGKSVEVLTLWEAYRDHLEDYDVDTVAEITGAPAELIQQLADDIATIKPVSIHTGEGVNHYFHATHAQPRDLPAADADRQHRHAGRRQPLLGWQLQGRALPVDAGIGAGLQGLGRRRPVRDEPRRTRDPASEDRRARVHEGRGAGVLGPRRPGAHRRHAESRAGRCSPARRTCRRRRRSSGRRTSTSSTTPSGRTTSCATSTRRST